MTTRGSYSKSVARREEILTTALQVIADRGFNGATLRDLADAANLSITGLVHHFGTKEALLTEVLRRRDQNSDGPQTHDVEAAKTAVEMMDRLGDVVRENSTVPGLIKLYTNLSADATSPEHPGHEYFRERYEATTERGRQAIEHLQSLGELPSSLDAGDVGVLITAVMDGLQLQLQYNPGMDMARPLRALGQILDIASHTQQPQAQTAPPASPAP